MKKYFRPLGVGGASALLVAATLLSNVIGLVRDKVIAYYFGTTIASDTYNASFVIPDTIFNTFIASALVAAFMPVFTGILHKNKEEAYSIANSVIVASCIFVGIISVLALIFTHQLVYFLFPNISSEGQESIITMTRLMLPSAIIFSISNTLGNVLMTFRKFTSFSISPILYNLGIIGGVLFLSESFGIYSAAIGVVTGATLHLLVRVVDAFYSDYKFKFELKVLHPGFIQILKLMWPKAISLAFWQINVYLFASVGMRMVTGGLAAFGFAKNLQSFAVSLFGVSLATAVFPILNSSAALGNKEEFTSSIQVTIQRILFYTIPAAVGLYMLSDSIITLILKGGVFDESSMRLTSIILIFFAISVPLESLTHIFARAFYAVKDAITPMWISMISMTIIALITIFIAPNLGIEWLSIAFTIGYAVYNILFIIFLAKHLHGFKFKIFFTSIVKTGLSTFMMAVGIYLAQFIDFHTFKAIPSIAIGGSLFLLTAFLLKSPEFSSITFIFRKLFKKNA